MTTSSRAAVDATATARRCTADAAHGDGANGDGDHGDGANITEVTGPDASGDDEVIESVGGADAMEEVPERTHRPRARSTRSRKSSSAGRSCWCRS